MIYSFTSAHNGIRVDNVAVGKGNAGQILQINLLVKKANYKTVLKVMNQIQQ
jgi:hypothetical protein